MSAVNQAVGATTASSSPVATGAQEREAAVAASLQLLRVALGLQVLLGLLWGVSMLVFARAITTGDPSGAHVEKIALEGAAHLTLVFAAILVWRAPRQSRDTLLVMIFLNGLWALTDAVYMPLFGLAPLEYGVKLVVNAALAVLLFAGGRRAGILSR